MFLPSQQKIKIIKDMFNKILFGLQGIKDAPELPSKLEEMQRGYHYFLPNQRLLFFFTFLINNQMMFLMMKIPLQKHPLVHHNQVPLWLIEVFFNQINVDDDLLFIYILMLVSFLKEHITFHFKDPTLQYAQRWGMINLDMNCRPC